MTDKASPDRPPEEPDLARFLQDWTAMWRGELQTQANDPETVAGAMEMWRAAMAIWSSAPGMPPMRPAASRDWAKTREARARDPGTGEPGAREPIGTPRAAAADVASDPRDAEIERLARRVVELEARIAKLEAGRRRRG
jgi:hypothetical protein